MIGKDDSHLVEPAVNACIAVVTEDEVFSGAQCDGGGGIAGIFHSGQMIWILFQNSIDIEDAIPPWRFILLEISIGLNVIDV